MRSSLAVLCCAGWIAATAATALTAPAAAPTRLARPPAPAAPGGPGDTALVHIGPVAAGTRAFVAWPVARANAPCVIVCHEEWGLNDQVRGVARRLAQQGYVAVVPDLYHGRVASDPDLAHELSRALEDRAAFGDLDAAIGWLRAQPATAKSRLGVIGFCTGGSLSQGLAMRRSDLAAVVMFCGGPETHLPEIRHLGAPLLAHFGATDKEVPVSAAEDLRKALHDAGKRGEVYVYPGAGHAFMNETRPSYHADAARQAWARTLAFLQRTLKD